MNKEKEILYTKVIETFNAKKCWGLMAAIDLKHCNVPSVLEAESFINKLIDLIKMNKFGDLKIERFKDHYIATQLIETSLVSCIFRYKCSAHIDIFSCKLFNPYLASEFIMEYFDTDNADVNIIYRN